MPRRHRESWEWDWYDDEGNHHTVLDAARLSALPRQLGKMRSTEQVRALADTLQQQKDTHWAAVQRGEYCPHCETKMWTQTAHEQCPEWQGLDAACGDLVREHRIMSLEGYALLRQRDAHQRACDTCQTVVASRTYLANCPQWNQWAEEWRMTVRRAEDLEQVARLGRCSEPGCHQVVFGMWGELANPPASPLCYRHLRKLGPYAFKMQERSS
jgi:hypothetical protein